MSTDPTARDTSQSTALSHLTRSPAGILLTLLTLICAAIWFFPIYWALITSLRSDQATVQEFGMLPTEPTLSGYIFAIINSELPIWYLNSTIVSVSVTVLVVFMSACTGFAISQLRFPGRMLLWWTILASFMVPITALIREPLHHHRRCGSSEHPYRDDPAHAAQPRHRHCLQAIL
jgi:ABC-type glycerol-3-phosphate transport system permease component